MNQRREKAGLRKESCVKQRHAEAESQGSEKAIPDNLLVPFSSPFLKPTYSVLI